jgi:hypothetical protein
VQAIGMRGLIRITPDVAGIVDGCEQALKTAGQFWVGAIHRYLDSNLRF